MKKLIIIFLIVLSVLAYMQIKGWIAASGPLLNVTNVVVPKGASLKTVAEELSRAGVIDKPWLFRIMVKKLEIFGNICPVKLVFDINVARLR